MPQTPTPPPAQTSLDEADLSPLAIPGEPIGATDAWRVAARKAEGQCQDERERRGARKAARCTRTLNGGHKLFLWTDGRLYCAQHYDDRRLGRR